MARRDSGALRAASALLSTGPGAAPPGRAAGSEEHEVQHGVRCLGIPCQIPYGHDGNEQLGSTALQPLLRRWHSERFGLLAVMRAQYPQEGERELEVWTLRAGGAGRLVLGKLVLRQEPDCTGQMDVMLEMFHRPKHFWRLRLAKQFSRRRRVLWFDARGEFADCWDGKFLDTIRKADEWLDVRRAEVGLPLASHRNEQEDQQEQQSDVWLLPPHASKLEEPLLTCSTARPAFTLALCVTSFNRLWQLRRALPLNLMHCWRHRDWVRFHVVDFGSTDGSLKFVQDRCHAAMRSGMLRLYHTDQLPFWHASVAKNTAHLCADEDILVNLDGDNLVGPHFVEDVVQHFINGYTVLQYHTTRGTCGRIACTREQFHYLRGYDEDAHPMGAQDTDLVLRLCAMQKASFRRRYLPSSGAIPNDNKLKVACCSAGKTLRWGQMDTLNQQIFRQRRESGQLVRNLHRPCLGVAVQEVLVRGVSETTKP